MKTVAAFVLAVTVQASTADILPSSLVGGHFLERERRRWRLSRFMDRHSSMHSASASDSGNAAGFHRLLGSAAVGKKLGNDRDAPDCAAALADMPTSWKPLPESPTSHVPWSALEQAQADAAVEGGLREQVDYAKTNRIKMKRFLHFDAVESFLDHSYCAHERPAFKNEALEWARDMLSLISKPYIARAKASDPVTCGEYGDLLTLAIYANQLWRDQNRSGLLGEQAGEWGEDKQDPLPRPSPLRGSGGGCDHSSGQGDCNAVCNTPGRSCYPMVAAMAVEALCECGAGAAAASSAAEPLGPSVLLAPQQQQSAGVKGPKKGKKTKGKKQRNSLGMGPKQRKRIIKQERDADMLVQYANKALQRCDKSDGGEFYEVRALGLRLGLNATLLLGSALDGDTTYALVMWAVSLIEAQAVQGLMQPPGVAEFPLKVWKFLSGLELKDASQYPKQEHSYQFYDEAYLATHIAYILSGYGRYRIHRRDAVWLYRFLRDNFYHVLRLGELDLVAEFVDNFRQLGCNEANDLQVRDGTRFMLRLYRAANSSWAAHREPWEADKVGPYSFVHKPWTAVAGVKDRKIFEPRADGTYGQILERYWPSPP